MTPEVPALWALEEQTVEVRIIRARWHRGSRLDVRTRVENPRPQAVFVIAELLGVTRTESGYQLMWAHASEQPGALWRPAVVDTVPAGDATELDATVRFPIATFSIGDSLFDMRAGALVADLAADIQAVVGWYPDVATLGRAERSRENALALQRLASSSPARSAQSGE